MKFFLKDLKSFFSSTRRETVSLLLLIPLLFLVLYTHRIYNFIYSLSHHDLPPLEIIAHYQENHEKESNPIVIQKFKNLNPNTMTSNEWESLGFDQNTSNRIVKYRLKGGFYNGLDDLLKIYSIDTTLLLSHKKTFIFDAEKKKRIEKQFYSRKEKVKKESLLLKAFDPNHVSEELLAEMQLPSSFINSLLGYRSKGGQFKTSEDLLKLYGLNSSLYKVLKDSLLFDIDKNEIIPNKKVILVNLNTATIDDLTKIKGIGLSRGSSIINFRKRLGGSFYKKDQLLEVYSIDSILYEDLKRFLFVEESEVKKIKLNFTSYEKLATHPYLTYRQAKWIINYRNQHGNYDNYEEILNIKTLNLEDIQKILPYLDFSK